MYSVVLATMLAAGSSTPAWHHGCHGCYSGCYSSCYSCYACYSGYSCYGCYGGCYGCSGGLFHHHRGYSSCYCSSCYGGCYSSCYSCYSSCYSCYSGCCGGYYSGGCYGGCCGGVILQQSSPQVIPVNPKGEPVPAPKKEETARVTINLPSDARMWVDSVECPLTSATRSFSTPTLQVGQRYVYNIRAEVVRDGRTITETQRVVLTPGQESRVDFNTNGGAIATASAAR